MQKYFQRQLNLRLITICIIMFIQKNSKIFSDKSQENLTDNISKVILTNQGNNVNIVYPSVKSAYQTLDIRVGLHEIKNLSQ